MDSSLPDITSGNTINTSNTSIQDLRPYVARFMFGKPIMVAKSNLKLLEITENIRYSPISQICVPGNIFKSWNWCEIQYSKRKGQESIEEVKENSSTMIGPDLYHLYDENNKIRVNIWIPITLKNKIEVVYYDENEQQILTQLYNADIYEGKVLHDINQYFNAQNASYRMKIEWNIDLSQD